MPARSSNSDPSSPMDSHGDLEEVSLAHLEQNRPQIILRSLLYGLAGLVPVPLLDDSLRSGIRRGLLFHIARSRKVDLTDAAADALLAEGASDAAKVAPGIIASIGGALAFLRKRPWTRRFLGVLMFARQVLEIQRVYQQATLFDHYCARHHLGPGLDGSAASMLKGVMDETGRAATRDAISDAAGRAVGLLTSGASYVKERFRRDTKDESAPTYAEKVDEKTLLGLVSQGTRHLLADVTLHRHTQRLVSLFDRRWQGRKDGRE